MSTGQREYTYSICVPQNISIFKKQCEALENHIPNLAFVKEIKDVDSTTIRHYILNGKNLYIYNSYDVNEVYIVSEFDIDPYFA